MRWMTVFLLVTTVTPTGLLGALPDFQTVQQAVEKRFATLKDHEATDLISRDQVEAVLDDMEKLGWQVTDRDEIAAATLSSDNPLVVRLRTKSGKKFMRQATRYPQAYDRLEHLGQLSDGKRILDRLIDGPDGYKLIEYLTSSSGGKNMGRMLNAAPHGADFNKKTGRIYTQKDLLERLKRSHSQAQ